MPIYPRPLSSMTLREAVEWLAGEEFACACGGGSWCCLRLQARALALVRTAHIAIEMIDRVSTVFCPEVPGGHCICWREGDFDCCRCDQELWWCIPCDTWPGEDCGKHRSWFKQRPRGDGVTCSTSE